jgi:hypothetical protein
MLGLLFKILGYEDIACYYKIIAFMDTSNCAHQVEMTLDKLTFRHYKKTRLLWLRPFDWAWLRSRSCPLLIILGQKYDCSQVAVITSVIFDGTWMGTLLGTCSMHFETLSLVILDNLTASSHYLHVLFTDHCIKSLFIQPLKKNSSLIYQHIYYNKVEVCSIMVWLQGSHTFWPTIQVL